MVVYHSKQDAVISLVSGYRSGLFDKEQGVIVANPAGVFKRADGPPGRGKHLILTVCTIREGDDVGILSFFCDVAADHSDEGVKKRCNWGNAWRSDRG